MKLPLAHSPDLRVAIVMPAYNAARTLAETIAAIPAGSFDDLILVDDASSDGTAALARALGVPLVIEHPANRGYGANQKTCYAAAVDRGADIVVMLHPDNQYDPRLVPSLVLPIYLGQSDVALASRFVGDPIHAGPKAGGMPLAKRLANRLLTTAQNLLMGTRFSEFHTGYRAYSRDALRRLAPLDHLSDGFLFDNQILARCVEARLHVSQVGVETRYFPEASSIPLSVAALYAIGCLRVAAAFAARRAWARLAAPGKASRRRAHRMALDQEHGEAASKG